MDHLIVAIESPLQPEIERLIAELDAYLRRLYPPASNHLLDIERLTQADMRFFVARQRHEALGCGALRVDEEGYGEIKRVFVTSRARRLHVGRHLLHRIEAQAREEGLHCLRLETGIHQHEALAVFRKLGYEERGPFGEYQLDPLSVFMEKPLAPSATIS